MIAIGKVLVSDEIFKKQFACKLSACKGACCVEGDDGAYVAEEETGILDDIYDDVKDYLTEKGRQVLETGAKYTQNSKGAFRTPLIDGRACAYITYEGKDPKNSIAYCGIEKAWADGKTDFKKPVSCHLYPIRVSDLGEFEAINFESWDICNPACANGETLGLPVYKFLREPLERKYGEEFYEALEAAADYLEQQKKNESV